MSTETKGGAPHPQSWWCRQETKGGAPGPLIEPFCWFEFAERKVLRGPDGNPSFFYLFFNLPRQIVIVVRIADTLGVHLGFLVACEVSVFGATHSLCHYSRVSILLISTSQPPPWRFYFRVFKYGGHRLL